MVHRQITFFEHGGTLELSGCYFIMAGADRYAKLMTLGLEIEHEIVGALRDASEIVVFQLLPFSRCVAHQRAAAQHQVGTGMEKRFIHEEIFLLPAQGGTHPAHVLVKILANRHSSRFQKMQTLQQRRFVVQRLAGIGYEDGGDTKGLAGAYLHDESRGGGIPGGIAAGLKSAPDASARETGSVGFLLHQR